MEAAWRRHNDVVHLVRDASCNKDIEAIVFLPVDELDGWASSRNAPRLPVKGAVGSVNPTDDVGEPVLVLYQRHVLSHLCLGGNMEELFLEGQKGVHKFVKELVGRRWNRASAVALDTLEVSSAHNVEGRTDNLLGREGLTPPCIWIVVVEVEAGPHHFNKPSHSVLREPKRDLK